MPKQELPPEPSDESKEKILGSENVNDWEQDEQGVFQLKKEVKKAQLEEAKTPEKIKEEKGKLNELYEDEVSKPKDSGSEQISETEVSPKQRLFRAACNERLDELVQLGILPKQFADDRRKSADLIEVGLSNNPEEQGREFAEIGTEGIGAFSRAVDEAMGKANAQVQPYLELVHDLIARFEADGQEKKVSKLKKILLRIEENLDEFEERANRVKDLEIPFKDLNAQIIDLEALGEIQSSE